jgi:hypothetical protein
MPRAESQPSIEASSEEIRFVSANMFVREMLACFEHESPAYLHLAGYWQIWTSFKEFQLSSG